ncbi:MAG: hypothetical protein VR72_10705 [Clostridiaceae bacterium BRH_c20a]|nr:MAG: hypothetical protein VR72_10705 [Clostridiaceae bacterium BRH_c20a]
MKITKIAEQIGNIGKRDDQKEKLITISEAHTIWETLTAKYDAMHLTNILLIFTKDDALKIIIKDGIEALKKQIVIMEKLMNNYNVPLTNRPPEKIHHSDIDINIMTDQVIYRTIHTGMQGNLMLIVDGFRHAISSIPREAFRNIMIIEMDLYDAFTEYGKLKGYLLSEPSFRP